MSNKPFFYLLAGPNGAGKSTLYRSLVRTGLIDPAIEFVNADLFEASHLTHITDPQERSLAARDWADRRRTHLLSQRQTFVSETVFSHESKLKLLDNAIACGFYVTLFVVALDNPEQLLLRVKQRIAEGGHSVPPERVLARYPRTLANLSVAVYKAHTAALYDSNELLHTGHQRVVVLQDGQLREKATLLPNWAKTVLGLAG